MRLHLHGWGGGRRTAVLVHGLTDDHTTWWQVAPHLVAQGFRVLAPDLRGHGRSDWSSSYHLAEFAADLIESVPTGVQLVVGHSLGALAVSLAAEALRPGSLVYLDPPFRTDLAIGPPSEPVDEWQARRWSPEDRAADAAALARMDPAVSSWVPGRVVGELAAAVPARLVAPTLVIEPEWRPLTDRAVRAGLERQGFVFRQLADTRHVMHRDDPAALLRCLDEHVQATWSDTAV